jgi:hypothetical protein
VFLVDPNGEKNPLVRLDSEDQDILNRALEFPTRDRFLRAGRQIAEANWIPAFQPRPILKINENGDPLEVEDKSYRQLVPSSLRPNEKKKAWGMEIQFWKITYDPHTRIEHAILAETFNFTPQDLYNPNALFRPSTPPPE